MLNQTQGLGGNHMNHAREQKLAEFVEWSARYIRGDEKSEAQIFLDRMFQAFGQPGLLDVGGQAEFRVRKSKDDGRGESSPRDSKIKN